MLPPDSRAWVEIDRNALHDNIAYLKTRLPQQKLMAVVKADAYGHGLLPVARAAIEAGADWLGVAATAEGVVLREAGVTVPIALLCALSPVPAEAEAVLRYQITPFVGDSTTRDALADASRRLRLPTRPCVHLEIETGMGRAGITPENAVLFWKSVEEAGLHVTGLCAHYADAENTDGELTCVQASRFQETQSLLKAAGAQFKVIHSQNSAAALQSSLSSATNLVRPGLLIYGIVPEIVDASIERERLKPVLSLKVRVATVRELPAGHTISYGGTHTLRRPSRVATLLIGYGDGYPRALSNRGAVLLHGERAPILGRICMDQLVVDVTDIPAVSAGDIAICIGSGEGGRIRVEEIARWADTTEHAITTTLTPRLPRLYLPLLASPY